MIKELKELIEDISAIDTSIDMEDIKLISGLNSEIANRILNVRDFLIELNLPKTKETVEVKKEEVKEEIKKEEVKEEEPTTTMDSAAETAEEVQYYPELVKLGLTKETIHLCEGIYLARASVSKMSFSTLMQCCVFVHNFVVYNGMYFNKKYSIARLEVNKGLEKLLIEIDPDTKYLPANIHDFLAAKNFKTISSKFFECVGSTALTVDSEAITPDKPF